LNITEVGNIQKGSLIQYWYFEALQNVGFSYDTKKWHTKSKTTINSKKIFWFNKEPTNFEKHTRSKLKYDWFWSHFPLSPQCPFFSSFLLTHSLLGRVCLPKIVILFLFCPSIRATRRTVLRSSRREWSCCPPQCDSWTDKEKMGKNAFQRQKWP
jgi:hypothetical protein